MQMIQSQGLNSLSWCLTLFTNTIQLQNPSNTNLPPTKSSIFPHVFLSLFTPHDNIFEVTSSPPPAGFLHCNFFCFKQLWWRLQAVSSWVLFAFTSLQSLSALSSSPKLKKDHEDIFGAKHYSVRHWSGCTLWPGWPCGSGGHLGCDLCAQRKQNFPRQSSWLTKFLV